MSTPSHLGRYRLLRMLGQGAVGEVWLGYDPFHDREVAIKRLLAQHLNGHEDRKRYLKSFENEARLVGQLNHPHIVDMLDAYRDETGGAEHYVVMEYVGGGSLETHATADNLLPIADVVELTFKCCQALAYAHRQGLVHRDLKPANLLLDGVGQVKVADFGAAYQQNAGATQLTGLVGSPAYMSPEQVRDEALTQQSDIYSLGVVMYKLLTGRLPYPDAENTFSLMQHILKTPPRPIHSVRRDVPNVLADILNRALAKSCADRYSDWQHFAADLANSFSHLNLAFEHVPETERFTRLRSLGFFIDFTDAELWEVIRFSAWGRFARGTLLMKEGREGSSFYILVDGRAEVSREGRHLASLAAGSPFGEMAFLSPDQPIRSASVTATEDVLLFKVRAPALAQASLAIQARFDKAFLKMMVIRLQHANQQQANPQRAPSAN